MFFRNRLLLVISTLVSLLGLTTKPIFSQPTLKIGGIPDQYPEKLNRLYGLLSTELGEALNVSVRYVPVTNYPATVTAFRTGSIDLVWFGGLTGVQARMQRKGARIIAQRDIDAKFHSVFIANKSSNIPVIKNINELNVLKGRRFTFGSESSTSGRLMPQYYIQEAGLKISDFNGGMPGFSGSHDATIALVQSGSFEAGALNEQVWKDNLKTGRINYSRVKSIWRTPPYADYHWLAQPDLDTRFGKGFTKRLQSALLGMNNNSKSQAKILKLFGAKKFIPAKVTQYNEIERIGRQIGKIR